VLKESPARRASRIGRNYEEANFFKIFTFANDLNLSLLDCPWRGHAPLRIGGGGADNGRQGVQKGKPEET